jgi:hypothetical protein
MGAADANQTNRAIKPGLWLFAGTVGLVGCALVGAVATQQEIREIDVNSGRVRERHVVFGVQLAEAPVATHFARHFSKVPDPSTRAIWRTVSIKHGSVWFRMSILDRKEHFVFGDVYGDLESFALICDAGMIEESQCREHAEHLLAMLHHQNARAISETVKALQTATVEADGMQPR